MSLLMDALRKAEQAKRQAETSSASRGSQPAIEIEARQTEPSERAPAAGAPLPELPSKLELLDDQFGNVTEPSPARRPPPAPAPKPAVDELARERKAAQQVFAAKAPEDGSRRGFYLALGGATLAALIGIGGYFWWQLQPRSLVLAKAPASSPTLTQPAASGPTAAVSANGAGAAASTEGGAAQRVAAAAGTAVGESEPAKMTAEPPGKTGAAPPERQRRPILERGQLVDPAPNASAYETPIRVTRSHLEVDPALDRAYRHFQAGNLKAARSDYEQALRRDPRNIDALNGLATIALAAGDSQTADEYYQRALETDPRDATAQAGLMGVRGSTDPIQAESRLKTLIAAQPDADAAHFALGNLYAAQGRWHESQQAYFRAYTRDPENPDYQFNLAVSLDQLHQPRLALQYYEGALAAAASRPAVFDRAQTAARIRELKQP